MCFYFTASQDIHEPLNYIKNGITPNVIFLLYDLATSLKIVSLIPSLELFGRKKLYLTFNNGSKVSRISQLCFRLWRSFKATKVGPQRCCQVEGKGAVSYVSSKANI